MHKSKLSKVRNKMPEKKENSSFPGKSNASWLLNISLVEFGLGVLRAIRKSVTSAHPLKIRKKKHRKKNRKTKNIVSHWQTPSSAMEKSKMVQFMVCFGLFLPLL